MKRTHPQRHHRLTTLALCCSGLLLGGCGESGSSPTVSSQLPPIPGTVGAQGTRTGALGTELPKPGGGTFFLDPNQGGSGASVHIDEMFWGRLVDVHDADDQGNESPEPRFRDFVVNPNVQSDGTDYTLATSPITQRARLVIHAKKGSARFDALLAAAVSGMPPIVPKRDDGGSAPPFSLVPRNACLVARIDDLLDDDAAAAVALSETVHVRVGVPPTTPFGARLLFDPNHGGVVAGAFHSTRVLIDLSVSEHDVSTMPVPQPVNVLGLPPSPTAVTSATVSVRVPTRVDFGFGQFAVLTNVAGTALDAPPNQIDLSISTRDIMRGMRSGNADEANNGFLLDLEIGRAHV